ncbi:hydroxymethylglutaryl-CoA lyase [Pseudogracilibacillus auburnensis]|uniref:Hydroxymethylglutaryl-CoA lyase n=1 Tax=Pseudogracilibacillus auburnensis TaxID=1494959 RepID=A0A2V3VSE7_9BACI|nr:hydroxymethylglutaryl-CoA lyase [Pseudogracilibacillus auburnensis]MBO1004133.1 hydroxymethylglutaryl-CoA lyase [Pseudogracilibacillus auburnensis]PXW83628.1 hydroxymethylglutaryl-CoA lyase [Pseudogracilibacillus auburnensis]
MRWPNFVQIKEVGPRDGLQNEKEWVSTEDKVKWINMLSDSGVSEIEYSSFVHPKWIPALKDAREVGKRIKRNPNVTYSALVPNEKGLEHALEAGIDMASVFMSASETHNKKNINKSIAETYPIMKNVIEGAKQEKKRVTGYVSTVFDCPFEGKVKTDDVIRVCERLFEYGVDDISLGDTIGSAVPSQVEELLESVLYRFPNKNIIMHFHDTRGMAIANIVTSMRYGVTRFDSSLGGLGGCPYAPGAAGNVATNDILYLLHGLGISTGIDESKIQEAALFIQEKLEKDLPSRSLAYETSQRKKSLQSVQAKNESPKPIPQRKREIIYFFIKNQYEKLRSKAQ